MSNCYKCGDPGHYAAACPMAAKAAGHDEHMARIAGFVQQWVDGQLSTELKRIRISDENRLFYGPDCERRLIYP